MFKNFKTVIFRLALCAILLCAWFTFWFWSDRNPTQYSRIINALDMFFYPIYEKHSKFRISIQKNDFDKVLQLLSEDGSLIKGNHYTRPLLTAVQFNRKDMAELLINYGANINEKGGRHSEYTPLIWAAHVGNIEILELLLENGAKVDYVSDWGQTALMYAAQNGNTKCIEILLNNKAKINFRGGYHCCKTALECAAIFGHYESVKILLEKEAEFDIKLIDTVKKKLNSIPLASKSVKTDYKGIIKILENRRVAKKQF